MEVHFSGGLARLVDCGTFSVLYVSGVGVEDAARAIPGLRVLRVGGGVVVTRGGRPVVPVVGGGVERCVELASHFFDEGAWRAAMFAVRFGRLAAAGAVVSGVLSLVSPIAPLVGASAAFACASLALLALSYLALRKISRQVVYGSRGEDAVGLVKDEDYYVEAAGLCCEKAKRLLAEGKESEAMDYALRALNYASKVARVEVEASSPLQVVEAVSAALKLRKCTEREAVSAASTSKPNASTCEENVELTVGEVAGGRSKLDQVLEAVEAYAYGKTGKAESKGRKEGRGKEKGGSIDDYV